MLLQTPARGHTGRKLRRLLVAAATSGALVAGAAGALFTGDAVAQPVLLPDSPLGAHAMLQWNTPLSADDALFSQAAAEDAGTVRLDIFMPQITTGGSSRDWGWLNRVRRLAWQYRLRVLINLTGMPADWASCSPRVPRNETYRCPAKDPASWGGLAGEIAAQLRGLAVAFEIWNEPDGAWTYLGTPQQYGALLAAAVRAIHANNPTAAVTNGGIMRLPNKGGVKWLRTALLAAGPQTWGSLGMLNVHLRGAEGKLVPAYRAWRRFAIQAGRPTVPIWVTEAGYASDPAHQTDPSYRGGELGQSRYVAAALHDLFAAGAAKIFITQRDMGRNAGAYASEGVLAGIGDPVPSNPSVRRRSAFYACRGFAAQHLVQAPVSILGVAVPGSGFVSGLIGPGS